MENYFYIAISLILVTLGANFLVRGASLLALRAGVSPLFIGLTVVGFGTSSPELGASLTATLAGLDDVSVGNVIGSSIFNIALILGTTAVICPITVHLHVLRTDLFVALAAALLPFTSFFFGGVIPRPLGVLMVLGLVAYIYWAYRVGQTSSKKDEALVAKELRETLIIEKPKKSFLDSILLNSCFVLLGLFLLVLGSKLFVENAVQLARTFGISELVIGLTIVSAGTSLPELFTSVVAALKKNTDIAIGNIIGSNIFNIFGILGICAVVKPQAVHEQVLYFDAPIMLLLTLALLPIIKSGSSISRPEGFLLLATYLGYFGMLLS